MKEYAPERVDITFTLKDVEAAQCQPVPDVCAEIRAALQHHIESRLFLFDTGADDVLRKENADLRQQVADLKALMWKMHALLMEQTRSPK